MVCKNYSEKDNKKGATLGPVLPLQLNAHTYDYNKTFHVSYLYSSATSKKVSRRFIKR